MPDPYAVFRASPGRHDTLKALWPDLYAVLAGPPKVQAERIIPCCVAPCAQLPLRERPRAVARVHRWGPAACAAHVKKLADQPGGWPLEAKGNR